MRKIIEFQFIKKRIIEIIALISYIFLICFDAHTQNIPTLIYPFKEEITNNQQIVFRWNRNPHENALFQFQLSADSIFSQIIVSESTSNSNYLSPVLGPNNQSYFWRVRKLNPNSNWSESRKVTYFNPRNISGLAVWLDPTFGVILTGSNVSQITDKAQVGNNAIQPNSNQRPLFISADSLINNMPSLRYDGVDDFLDISDNSTIDFVSEFTTFTLVKPRVIASNKTILAKWDYQTQGAWVLQTDFSFADELMFAPCFTLTDPGNQKFYTTNADLLALRPVLITMKYQGNQPVKTLFFKNSVSLNTALVGSIPSSLPNSAASLKVGKYGGTATRYYDGDITEVLIYNTSLTNSSQKLIENYLRFKYAPPVNLGPDTIIALNSNCGNLQLKAQFRYTNYLWSNGSTAARINVQVPGKYWVRVTDFMGNISSDTINVYPPYSFNLPQNNIVCIGDTLFWTTNFPASSFSFQWSDGSTAPTIPISDAGMHFVRITDLSGCDVQSDTLQISMDFYPQTATLGLDTNLCLGNSIQLQNGQLETVHYQWNDGSTNSFFTVSNSGVNNISLIALNNNGCVLKDTIEVTVVGTAPTLNFSIHLQTCQFDALVFNDSSFVPDPYLISEVKWIFNGADTLSQISGSYFTQTSGTLNVKLEVSSAQCQSSANFNVVVHPKPIVSFTTQKFCPYDAVEFTASNSQPSTLSSQLWNFDDNSTSSSSNPTHVFGTTGTYNVSLQAQDINGCRDTIIQAVYIQPQPVADFSFINTCELSAVNFTNNSNIADTFSLVTNQWSYGDGTQATNPSFQKVYQEFGDYEVELVVTANNGCQDTLSQTITIHPKPILGWQVGPSCKGLLTSFSSSSTVPLGEIVATDWLVNLQFPQSGIEGAYRFVTTGTQFLTLSCTSNEGCVEDTLIRIQTNPELRANFSVFPNEVVAGKEVRFNNLSVGANVVRFEFGDGTIQQFTNTPSFVNHIFADTLIEEEVTTWMYVNNNFGCTDSMSRTFIINRPDLDLELSNMFIQEINGFFKVGVEMRNRGKININQVELIQSKSNGSKLKELYNGLIQPGQSVIYLFNADMGAFYSDQDNQTDYVCVEGKIKLPTENEPVLTNNTICQALEEGLILSPVFPNPTEDILNWSVFNTNETTTMKVDLFATNGALLQSTNYVLSANILETHQLDVSELSTGTYLLKMEFNGSVKVVRFMKQ
jgi:hypothetical protein